MLLNIGVWMVICNVYAEKKNGVYIHNYVIRPYLLNIIWPEHYVIGLLLLIDEDFGEFYKTKDQW